MLKNSKAFSGFSVKNLNETKKFYTETLGLEVEETPMGLNLKVAGSNPIFVYQKDNHEPATYTILNFPVDNIDQAFDELADKGVKFEHYPEMTDEKGIARGIANKMGPDIAWFKDPSGNILSILSND